MGLCNEELSKLSQLTTKISAELNGYSRSRSDYQALHNTYLNISVITALTALPFILAFGWSIYRNNNLSQQKANLAANASKDILEIYQKASEQNNESNFDTYKQEINTRLNTLYQDNENLHQSHKKQHYSYGGFSAEKRHFSSQNTWFQSTLTRTIKSCLQFLSLPSFESTSAHAVQFKTS